MQEECLVVLCPNPRCQREIAEPVLLNNLSVTPAEQYDACPHCFARLEPKATFSQEEDSEKPVPSLSENMVLEKGNDSSPRLWERVKDLIARSNGSQEEKGKKREEPKPKSFTRKEKDRSGCPQNFGYLANRPKDAPIPQECLLCPKMVDCMLKVEE